MPDAKHVNELATDIMVAAISSEGFSVTMDDDHAHKIASMYKIIFQAILDPEGLKSTASAPIEPM